MRRTFLILLSLNLLLCGGCAVFNRNNTPALNFVEQHLLPKEKTARMLSYPLVVPVGFAAATLDMVLFHPISVAKDAWDDTNELLWENLDWENRYVTTTILNAPRIVAEPVIFTTDFLARSSFDISRRGGDIRLIKSDNKTRNKDKLPSSETSSNEARKALEQKDVDTTLRPAQSHY